MTFPDLREVATAEASEPEAPPRHELDPDEELLKALDADTRAKIKVLRRLGGNETVAELLEQLGDSPKGTTDDKGPKKRGWFGR